MVCKNCPEPQVFRKEILSNVMRKNEDIWPALNSMIPRFSSSSRVLRDWRRNMDIKEKHNRVYRYKIIILYTWNLYHAINQNYLNKKKKEKKTPWNIIQSGAFISQVFKTLFLC